MVPTLCPLPSVLLVLGTAQGLFHITAHIGETVTWGAARQGRSEPKCAEGHRGWTP